MRDVYLLAAGLLTGLAVPVSTLTQQSMIEPENHQLLSSFKQDLQPVVGETVTPTVETSLPEFSNQMLPAPAESSFQSTYQPTRKIVSGKQLYHYRLAALKAGQIYTRLADDDLQSLWESGNKQQLTYEDWKSLLAMEAKAIAKGQGVNHLSILVGDSLSMWFPKEKLPSGKLWLNQGISGDTSSGIFKRLSAFAATKPDVIYIMAGINDLRKGATDEAILSNHYRIIKRLQQNHPDSLIYVQSILPTRMSSISNSRIRRLNHQLALIAKREGVKYLNLYDWFADFQGNLRDELTTDGLHLSEEGYKVWHLAIERIESQVALGKIERSHSQ